MASGGRTSGPRWAVAVLGGVVALAGASSGDEGLEVRFAFDPQGAPVRRVCVAGEWNGWGPDAWPLERGADGVFRGQLRLTPGVYRYKLVVDGAWTHDPTNPRRDPDGHRNSVLVVGDVPAPDLSPQPTFRTPRPALARAGAFQVVPADALPAPPAGLAARPVFVYLPPSYGRDPARRYPVLYLHDGQNVWSEDGICFGHGGWYLDATLERLWAEGTLEELIAVGVPHGEDRLAEYGVTARGAEAPYVRWLLEGVKPAVDARFRTRAGPEATAVLGSSMGGLVSFAIALARPDVVGAAACVSSSFWWTDAAGASAFDLLARRGRQPVRLYLDSGTGGTSQDGAPDTRRMRDALRAAGWRGGVDLEHVEVEGATHDERAWRARLERPLRFLFGRR